jgi:hypothetical protein
MRSMITAMFATGLAGMWCAAPPPAMAAPESTNVTFARDRVRTDPPKGTILHIVGYMDNSPSNKNVVDPRNWSGSGNRSIANMFIDLGNRVTLTDEQFRDEMLQRIAVNPGLDVIPGCPLCGVVARQQKSSRLTQNQQH